MATTETARVNVGPSGGNPEWGATTRLDPPHVPVESLTGSPGFPGARLDVGSVASHEEFTSLTDNSLRVMDRLRHHANQLATHLQKQQKDIDDREARLNAHVASHESEVRTFRVRQKELEKQLGDDKRALIDREKAVQVKETLQVKQKLQSKQVTSPLSAAKQKEKAKQDQEKLSIQVKSAAQKLCQQQESVTNKRQKTMMLELTKKKEKLDQRAEQLDCRRTELDDLRREVTQLHKDTLEMRLATEELWVRISGRMPSSAMTEALTELQGKLSNHYRLAAAHLTKQKTELETLGNDVHEKYQRLDEYRRNVQQWVQRRNREIEEQAARLVRREQELDRQETFLRQLQEQSQAKMTH